MPLQLGHVVERVDIAQPTGVDQAHEQVARLSAVQSLVKLCVFSMKHSTFQSLLADVVIKRRSRMPQESGQSFPVPQQ